MMTQIETLNCRRKGGGSALSYVKECLQATSKLQIVTLF